MLSGKYILPFSAAAVVLVVGGVFVFGQMNQNPAEQQPQPTPTPSPTPTPQPITAPEIPEDWQTYRNEEFGFELAYPSNVELQIISNDFRGVIDNLLLVTYCVNKDSCTPILARLHISKSPVAAINDLQYQYENWYQEPRNAIKREILSIAGKQALHETLYNEVSPANIDDWFHVIGDNGMLYSFLVNNREDNADALVERAENSFLDTFRFTE